MGLSYTQVFGGIRGSNLRLLLVTAREEEGRDRYVASFKKGGWWCLYLTTCHSAKCSCFNEI